MDSSFSSSTKPRIEDIRPKAHKLCDIHLGGAWRAVPVDELSIVPVSGGMSNFLYCCSLPSSISVADGEPSKVLLRLYGSMIPECDIATQLEILNQLSSRELGPKIYGSFKGGRLEEFLPANSLTSEQLVDSEISAIIASKLAAIHDLDLSRVDNLDNRWLVNRLCEWSKLVMDEKEEKKKIEIEKRNKCSRAEQPCNNTHDSLSSTTCSIADELLAIDYQNEVDFIRRILRNCRSPQVFSHNDLHQGNILLATHSEQRSTLEERVIIIDFEYCSYNYRAFDIANHFSEWCFEYDTKEFPHFRFDKSRFPSTDTQRRFARNYLQQATKLSSSKSANTYDNCSNGSNNIMIKQQQQQQQQQAGDEVSQDQVEALVDEVKPFLMASNLMWALWCIRSARESGITFGYWEHAKARWQLYSEFKLNFIKKGCLESVMQNGAGATNQPRNISKSASSSHSSWQTSTEAASEMKK